MRGIEAQFLALQKGFTELIPQHLLKPFDHKELEVSTAFVLAKAQSKTTWKFSVYLFVFKSFPPLAHHRRAGEDRHSGLEDQHPPEALHK